MVTYIWYALAFVLIGLFAGLVTRRHMLGDGASSLWAHLLFGLVGSVAGGLGWLGLRWFGWNVNPRTPEGAAYASVDVGQAHNQGYWIALVIAPATALLVLALYKLISSRRSLFSVNGH